jgi:hypothetical protein
MFLEDRLVGFVGIDARLQSGDALPRFFRPRRIGLEVNHVLVFANQRRGLLGRDLLMLLLGGDRVFVCGFLLRVAATQ